MKKLFYSVIAILFLNNLIAQPTLDLVAYWPMNGNFNDEGPFSINGTNNGATSSTNYNGLANTAINFSNPSSTVPQFGTHPFNSNIDFSNLEDFTCSFSVFANSPLLHVGGIYDNNLNYAGPGVFLWNSNGFSQIVFLFKNGSIASTSGGFLLGVWNKISCVRASGTLKIYINGVLNCSGPEGSTTPIYNYPGKFGTMSYSGYTPPQYNGFNGKLDEFRIYKRALSDAEITSLATLPIKLSSFTATNTNNYILLQWQTAYEQNSDYFNLQRSTDAVHFYTIGNIKAKGNSSVAINYHFKDCKLNNLEQANVVFYRLESFDIDGRFTYSNIIAIPFDNKKNILFNPNPVIDKALLFLQVDKKQQLQYRIIDKVGRIVAAQKVNVVTGNNSISFNLTELTSGIYWLELKGETIYEKKIFLKR